MHERRVATTSERQERNVPISFLKRDLPEGRETIQSEADASTRPPRDCPRLLANEECPHYRSRRSTPMGAAPLSVRKYVYTEFALNVIPVRASTLAAVEVFETSSCRSVPALTS